MFIKKILQLIIVAVPIFLFVWLLVIDISPRGKFVVQHEVDELSPYIDSMLPLSRVRGIFYTDDKEPYQRIIGDPVYVSMHLPQTNFETVDVELWFKNRGLPIIEFGPLVDIFSDSFDLRPVQNLLIDNSDWFRTEAGGITLLQRENRFESVSDFFDDLPQVSSIATYDYDLNSPYRIKNYRPLDRYQEVDVSLRGHHRYVTYIKNETFKLEAIFMDMNRTHGTDDIAISIFDREGNLVFEKKLEDDINTTENQISTTRTITVEIAGLDEGVYEVELRGTSDIFWRKLITTQRYMTFINRVYIGDDVGHLVGTRPTEFYTNAKVFVFETFHADAAQEVSLGSTRVAIPKSHEKVRVSISDELVVKGSTPAGDIKINSDGKIAFSKGMFFDPDPLRLTADIDLDARGVDYILTEYVAPEQVGDWFVSRSTFDIASFAGENNDIRFVLSTPLIESMQEQVDINAINLTFNKDPLSFKGFLSAIRERLPFGI